eukprot:TRINITY_DN92440_c0_g1_i1.p1 TRINITY_DN92440_c0_g1~~TRINITY_DN92440_c0_g1_i1.p1  ORF type:complete len:534 (-),score=61.48 TRINITY_DN92440_c0_g1_i1:272-1873(-)
MLAVKSVGRRVFNFGEVASPAECAALLQDKPECGPQFAFSRMYPSWGCRCCTLAGADGGEHDTNWDLFTATDWKPKPKKSALQSSLPKFYMYDLDASFRDEGRGCDLENADCAFGGPPSEIQGTPIWKSGQFEMPRMVYHRLLTSESRTRDPLEAKVFFIPAFRTGLEAKCDERQTERLWKEVMRKDKPLAKLKGKAQDKLARRHVILQSRAGFGEEMCRYVWADTGPQRLFNRVLLEIGDWCPYHKIGDFSFGRLWRWYSFPYPSFYHGPVSQIPAVIRPRGRARYLWSYFASGRGSAGRLRWVLKEECEKKQANRICLCPREPSGTNYDKATMEDQSFKQDLDILKRSVSTFKNSTFCVQPPGDTISRKGIIDSIIFGCIPVVFVPQQLSIWETHLSIEEFKSIVVYIPEFVILGNKVREHLSFWARLNLGLPVDDHEDEVSEEQAKYAWHTLGYDDRPWKHILSDANYSKKHSLTELLQAIPDSEIHRKQESLARLASRVHIGVGDERDAVSILFERIASDAENFELAQK